MKMRIKSLPRIIQIEEKNNIEQSPKIKIQNKNLRLDHIYSDGNSSELNQSWDFTPFPSLFFPTEKRKAIKEINGLNFQTSLNFNTPNNKNKKNVKIMNQFQLFSPNLLKSNSTSNIFYEIKGDITKYRAPAYSFGASREECKIPFRDFQEKISPSPGSYNVRPLLGLGGSSLKYSINKKTIFKKGNLNKNTGPGFYNIINWDPKNNGKIVLSKFPNPPISNFSKYTEKRLSDHIGHSDWNIKPDPGRYNVDSTTTMFKGTGKYPFSLFNSNISKSINKSNSLSRKVNYMNSPGPGHYNHYSIFRGYK